MAKARNVLSIPDEVIISKIYFIRGQKVMFDRDLAQMYNVSTSSLNKAVKRNQKRFPSDFMFQLTRQEYENLIFQIGTSSLPSTRAGWGGTRKLPHVFSEQGVAMLKNRDEGSKPEMTIEILIFQNGTSS